MRISIVLILVLLFAQPVAAESWFSRLFSGGGETAFSVEDRQQITDYFLQQARDQRGFPNGTCLQIY